MIMMIMMMMMIIINNHCINLYLAISAGSLVPKYNHSNYFCLI